MKKIFFCVIILSLFQLSAYSAETLKYSEAQNKIAAFVTKLPGIQAVGFKDFQSGETFFVSKKQYVPAASIIKMPVMAAVYMDAADGRLNLNERITLKSSDILGGSGILKRTRLGSNYSIRDLVNYMIVNSDNSATYMLIKKVGLSRIQRRIDELGLYNTKLQDETMLAEEPGHWMNLTTPEDMIKLLSLIYKGRVASKGYCDEMLEIMKKQHYRWGIPRKLPKTLEIANKTGFQDGVLNDIGIVFTDRGDFAVTIFVSNLPDMYTERNIINSISSVAYKAFMGMSLGDKIILASKPKNYVRKTVKSKKSSFRSKRKYRSQSKLKKHRRVYKTKVV